jgi:hypothetical protein
VLRVSIENIDRRQRKNLVVVSPKNFHIDIARSRFGCFTGRIYSDGCEEEDREEDRDEEGREEEEEVTEGIL